MCKKYKCNENRNVILLTFKSREVRKKTLIQCGHDHEKSKIKFLFIGTYSSHYK